MTTTSFAETRTQVLFVSVSSLLISLLFFTPGFPFPSGFFIVTLSAGVLYFLLFLFFKHLTRPLLNLIILINLFLLGLALHFSGGILSPLLMLLVSIIIARSEFGSKNPVVVAVPMAIYLSVAAIEYFDVFPPIDISPRMIYSSWPATLMVVALAAGVLLSTDFFYKLTINNLSGKFEKESALKQSVIKHLGRMSPRSEIGVLFNKIMHDIRGPLGAISGFVKMMEENPTLSMDSREDCRVMLRELDRILTLTNHMLTYIKPGQAGREFLCPIDLLDAVLSVASFYPGARGIRFHKNYSALNRPLAFANKEELQQVYFNLIKNSIEALSQTDPPKFISIEIQQHDSDVAINIHDNGPGFPQEVLEKQGEEMISTKKEGVGAGLVIAKEILDAYDGSLAIQNRQGRGASVLTKLPLAKSQKTTFSH